jgi:hypothetical protein
MGQYAEVIVTGARIAREYAAKLLVGIKPEQAARKPRFETDAAPFTVDTNHPTFVFGHLSLYPARILQMAGLDSGDTAAPEEWQALFKAGVQCEDDPTGTIYPTFDDVTTRFLKATDLCLVGIASLDDRTLLRPTPEERYREKFPLAGSAINFMLNNHVMMHMGQVSVWRRCFGLPPAM